MRPCYDCSSRNFPIRAPAAALCGLALALFAVRCTPEEENGSVNGHDDSGCNDTIGERGVVRFVFEEDSWVNFSAESGSRFATGTTIGFRAEPVDEQQSLPALRVQSSDPSVLEASTTSDPGWPYRLAFHAPGTARLELTDARDGQPVDAVTLAVADPVAIGLWAAPMDAEPLYTYLAEFSRQADQRIFLAPGSGARLVLTLEDGSENRLTGNWEPELSGPSELLALPEGRIPLGEQTWVSAHTVALLDVADAESDWSGTLHLTGPTGVTADLEVRRDATPLLETLVLVPSVFYDVDPDDPDSLQDPTEWWQVTQGDEMVLSAMGRTADGDPAIGYPVRFVSSDPRLIAVSPLGQSADSVLLRFRETGAAVITAVSLVDPSRTQQLRLLVLAP